MNFAAIIRKRLDYLESMQDYEVSTDTVRCWIDQYEDDIKNNRVSDETFTDLPKSEHVHWVNELFDKIETQQ